MGERYGYETTLPIPQSCFTELHPNGSHQLPPLPWGPGEQLVLPLLHWCSRSVGQEKFFLEEEFMSPLLNWAVTIKVGLANCSKGTGDPSAARQAQGCFSISRLAPEVFHRRKQLFIQNKEIVQISQLSIMLAKKLVTAQKRGETRALCLGLGMVACSMMMYFFIGITIVPFYTKSVWTTETVCKVLKVNIKDKVLCPNNEGSEDEDIFTYPCLQVWVNLTASGQDVMLYQTEDTLERNPKCSYVPGKSENSKEVKARIETIASNFKKYQTFPCYYDPGGTQTNVILSRLYPPKGLLFAFLWPTLMFTGGCLIIVLVKISQYVSVLSAWQYKINI
ncbi:calcium-activated potassium channel subunit beta-1 [Patagioenas fasciata monilis]|uniref:Calcium-activated potassium channel subunit beta-1 n=1 Tax=Patagioenas fasciata monilis TaxID=372326 RepID=A0A1V4KV24_PATFA|nr:calcium-activated potassium channel subunit beta-1 [Patagioenas fasciata monilis]